MNTSASARLPGAGPLLGLDWGRRRIGVACSDPDQSIAFPLSTLTRRTGRRFPLQQLREAIADLAPTGIVVGLPLESDGSEGDTARQVRREGARVEEATGLPLVYWDERMTTARVRRTARELGIDPAVDPARIDTLSAVVLLQHYLDSQCRPSPDASA